MNGKDEGPEKEEARAVVRMLGTNSVPLLLDWLRQEDRPSLRGRINTWRASLIHRLEARHIIKPRTITYLNDFNPSHRAMAMWALPELDSAAKQTVIPSLIQMLGDKEHKTGEMSPTAGSAYLVLSRTAPESIDPLIAALSSPDRQVRILTAGALGEIGPAAKAAIPVVEKGLKDKDPNIRVGAAEVVGKLGGYPDSFVPALVQALSEIDRENLGYVMSLLVRYKDHANAAVPVLIAILNKTAHSTNQTDSWVRSDITNTIRQIHPSALPPAPPVTESLSLPDETDDPPPSH